MWTFLNDMMKEAMELAQKNIDDHKTTFQQTNATTLEKLDSLRETKASLMESMKAIEQKIANTTTQLTKLTTTLAPKRQAYEEKLQVLEKRAQEVTHTFTICRKRMT